MLALPDLDIARPRTIAEVVDLLRGAPGDVMILAGGTDLLPALKQGLCAPKRVVSLRRVEGLRGLRYEPDGTLVIGAATTLAEVADHPLLRQRHPAIAEAASLVASPQIRNMATLGGNLCLDTRCAFYDQSEFWRDALGHCVKTCGDVCHIVVGARRCVAASAADTPAPLLAHGASLRLVSLAGERVVPLAAFFVSDGARNTTRANDEIITEVIVPPSDAGARGAYVKLRRRQAIDFPLLGLALTVSLDDDAIVRRLTMVVTALGARPRVVSGLDEIACGRRLDADVTCAIGRRAYAQCHPLGNLGGDVAWRREMIPVLVRRAMAKLATPRPLAG